MAKVILVNPSICTSGYSFITPRWLFVIAGATPPEVAGHPLLVDEALERFDPRSVAAGDIVGVGINSGNCLRGYTVLKQAKARGATVIMGGVHPTIFPEEALEKGADAVVSGNGDLAWTQAIRDALDGRLRNHYPGERVPDELLLKAHWDLLDPRRYMMASVQTVAGCPENCSFCSVWVTDGRRPRQRLADKIIEEVNELYALGFRYIVFADDNFNPATLGRIAREPSPAKRRELETIREERLRFFDEYDRRVPPDIFAFTQMTAEVISDEEYLSAMQRKMRIRTACIGVESFSEEGLRSAGKQWNPAGRRMVETIQKIQEKGILVLSSIICGLETDTVETIRTMRNFAAESGTTLAQFTFYSPYPGTRDFHEMMRDHENRGKPGYAPKHRIQIVTERFWLNAVKPVDIIRHPRLSRDELLRENRKCWDHFYSLRETWKRLRRPPARTWPLAGKLTYVLMCIVFKRVYSGHGISADSVQRKRMGLLTRSLVRAGVAVYSRFFRERKIGLRVSPGPPGQARQVK